MRGLWTGIWFLLPLLWVAWARHGLPGPALLFPRGPIAGPLSTKPPLAVWLIGIGLFFWASVLVWPPQTPLPSSTLFLIDNSSSMSEPALLANAKIGTRLGLGAQILNDQLSLLPQSDLVGLVRFSSMPRVLAPLTRERSEVARLLDRITPEKTPLDAQTNLVDALIEGLTRVLAVPSKAQRIILWTDGEANVRANASGWSLNTAAEAIRAFGVELVIVDGGPALEDLEGDKQTRQAEAKALLADLAKASGGKLLGPKDPVPLPQSGPLQNAFGFWNPAIRMPLGWILAGFGVGIWLFGKIPVKGKGALDRSLLWPPAQIRAYRGGVGFSTLGLVLGLIGIGLFIWNMGVGSRPRGILVDVQQGMLAGQPTRLEQARTLLERVMQNTPPTGELGLWVMGSHPECIMAPTEDWGAITDELQRLEAWAEDSQVWGPANPDALPLPHKGVWFWDGRDLDPFERGLPWGWSVVDMTSGEDSKAERFGETRVLAGNPNRVLAKGSWGRTIPRNETNRNGFTPIKQLLGAETGFSSARSFWALGLVAFFLMVVLPQTDRGSSEPFFHAKPRLAVSHLALVACLATLGALRAQGPGDQKKSATEWGPLQEKLESLKGLEPKELERGARDLIRQLEQSRNTNDPQWARINFLARAALWRAQRRPDAQHGPGNGESNSPGNTDSGIKPFPGDHPTQEFPIPGDLPMVEGPEGNRTPPLAGFEEQESAGLWGQLREAQKKVAREVTTRRLSRIIPRPWNPPIAEASPTPGSSP